MSGSSSTGPATERIAGLILGTLAAAVMPHDAGGQTGYANQAAARLLDADSGVVAGSDGSPAALLEAIAAALQAFRHRGDSDDRALLALRFTG
jgi:hypothetical protein